MLLTYALVDILRKQIRIIFRGMKKLDFNKAIFYELSDKVIKSIYMLVRTPIDALLDMKIASTLSGQ